jgi:tetratricopeptide (TPR) repeat protein
MRTGAWARASDLLVEALGLWRGTPLANVPSDLLRREHAPQLEQQRLQAMEWRVDADLRLGRAAEVLNELREFAATHPTLEYGHGQLMRALYLTGRRAEALDAYRLIRTRLVEELGVEPGAALQALHRRILDADPSLAADSPNRADHPVPAGAVAVGRVAPAQLPADVPEFTGRDRELSTLDGWPTGSSGSVAVVSGTAGVGKTALAIRWAHRVRDRYPDGQLYMNLRGYDLGSPVAAGDVLAGFLGALGMPARDIPVGTDERAARYRTETAERRMLIILDNAGSVAQVRPLLPGSTRCTVLVTSRDSLPGLVAVDGARRLDLEALPSAESVLLLRRLIGSRVDEQPEAARALAAQCAWLPLALRVVAELARSRPGTSLRDLTAELTDRQRRLSRLDVGGDPHGAVATVFSWSYRALSADAARVFRLLGLHPGRSADRYAAAALADITVDRAEAALRDLARAHLVHRVDGDRYGQHDLLRAYAAGLAGDEDGGDGSRAALDRLFDYFVGTAHVAVDLLHPADTTRRPAVTPPRTPVPDLVDAAEAAPWLVTELPALIAVAGHSARHGRPEYTLLLAETLRPYLIGVRYDDAVAIYQHVDAAAGRLGDRRGQALAQFGLGTANSLAGRREVATDQLRRAVDLFRAAGDPYGEARALSNLGVGEGQLGAYAAAFDHIEQALEHNRRVGDEAGQARDLVNLGVFAQRLGWHEASADYLEQARALFAAGGDRLREARTLTRLAVLGQRLGRFDQAADQLRSSLELHRALGDREGEAWTVNVLGDVERLLGHHSEAAVHHQQALTLARALGSPSREGEALRSLGRLSADRGRLETAIDYYHRALAVFRRVGAGQFDEAGVLTDLGEATAGLDRLAEAISHYTAALRLAVEVRSGECEVRARLGLGDAHRVLGDDEMARRHYHDAVAAAVASGADVPPEVHAYLSTPTAAVTRAESGVNR